METRLTLILPTYNEVLNIKEVLNLIQHNDPAFKSIIAEIIVVDDSSPDGTAACVQNYINSFPAHSPRVRLIEREGQRGLASAVRTGAEWAISPYVMVMDSDGQHTIKDAAAVIQMWYNEMDNSSLAASIAQTVIPYPDVVIGSRTVDDWQKGYLGMGLFRTIISRALTAIARKKLLSQATDPLSGLFIARKDLILQTTEDGFKLLLDILMTYSNLRVRETQIVLGARMNGRSKAGISEIFRLIASLRRGPNIYGNTRRSRRDMD